MPSWGFRGTSQVAVFLLQTAPEPQRFCFFLTQGIDLKVSFDDLLWARCLFDSRAVSVEMQAGLEGLEGTGGDWRDELTGGPGAGSIASITSITARSAK